MYVHFLIGGAFLMIGFILGIWLYPALKKPDGVFHVNLSDPMKDPLTLEFFRPLETLWICKTLFFVVKNDSKIREENNEYNRNVI